MGLLNSLINVSARLTHCVWNYHASEVHASLKRRFYSNWIRHEFLSCGDNCTFYGFSFLHGTKYCSIGNRVKMGEGVVLEVFDKYMDQHFSPRLSIGDDSNIGDNGHISCINEVRIGNRVRTGRRIFITDNAHGASERNLMDKSPRQRPLVSKGPVIIEDNVWIGEMVCIMPGVTIGHGSIIGANAVVTKDVPPYSVWGGNPAHLIKQL